MSGFSTTAFHVSSEGEPHHARTQALLKSHPEIRRLIGRNPWTGLLIVVTVAAQIALAVLLRAQPWWVVVIAAWTAGAFIDHALFVMVHECSHDLVFSRRWANSAAALVANLPQFFPTAVSFRHYHLKHHAHQGVHELDADLPSEWEARLVQNRTLGKAAWMLLFPFFQIARTFRLREIQFFDGWVTLNWILQIGFDVAVWFVLGPMALLYLACSLFFLWDYIRSERDGYRSIFSPMASRRRSAITGRFNAVALNVGYHNEHHDLPSVPWHRLPALKREAPEFYDSLKSHRSWSFLLMRFVFDRRLSLFSRTVRERTAR